MKLNRKLVLVLSLVLSLAIATGSTLAYLTDRDSEVNVFTVGDVSIDLTEEYVQGAELIPGVEISKKPTITNVGRNDAWVWATIAIPVGLSETIGDDECEVLSLSYDLENFDAWDFNFAMENAIKGFEIDGAEYTVYPLLYLTSLTPGQSTANLIDTVSLDEHIDIDPEGNMYHVFKGDVEKIDWNNANGNPAIYVSAYAIQTAGFDTVQAAYAAYNEQWGDNGYEWGESSTVKTVSNSADLKAALTADEKNIIVSLDADVTYDVNSQQTYAMGGASTETITINGNGHTITFNQEHSEDNTISANNGATLTITNAKLTNSGNNIGTWNRHDLNFACDVVLKNVTTDKALAFKADAVLDTVTINDANTTDTYAIWIQPYGQTVTLNNCTIDMNACTDGRGIKIDEQYVNAVAKVTLNVSNTKFKTEEKAAIMVKSVAGAKIVLSNNDISGVAADSTNPVWVDAASAAYDDLVTVTGGSKIVEP